MQGEGSRLWTRKQALTRHWIFLCLDLGLLAPRTLWKRFLLFIIYIIFVCNIQIIHRAQFALAEVGSSPCPHLFLPVRPPFSLPPAFEATLRLISISIIPLALLGSSLPVTSHSVLEHLYTWVSPTQEAAFYLFMTFHNFDDSQHNFFFFFLLWVSSVHNCCLLTLVSPTNHVRYSFPWWFFFFFRILINVFGCVRS